MKKRIFALLVLAALLIMAALPALASGYPDLSIATTENEPGAHVVDMANLLTDSEEAALREKLETISDKQNCDVVVVTTNSIGNKTAQDFADDYYDYNGYKPNGILLLVSMNTRDWHVSTTGRGIDAVNSAALKRIEKDVVPDLSDRNYYKAFKTFGDLSDKFLTLEAQGKPYKENLISTTLAAGASAVIGLLTGAIGTGGMKSKLKSVRQKTNASDYVKKGSLNIVNASEMFLYSNVSRTEIQQESRSGSGGTHTSSSGVTHGGGGGKF